MFYERLDFIADCYNPFLLAFLLIVIITKAFKKEKVVVSQMLFSLSSGLCIVYGLMFLDKKFHIWRIVGLEFSTHTAFSLCMIAILLCFTQKIKLILVGSLIAYFLLMLFQKYHTLFDIITTVAVILPLLILMLNSAMKLRYSQLWMYFAQDIWISLLLSKCYDYFLNRMITTDIKKHTLQNKIWVLYILECADQSLYTGITNRLAIRIAAHQAGIAARYTRGRLPVSLVYTEVCSDRSDASKRECAVKKLSKNKKLELIKKIHHAS